MLCRLAPSITGASRSPSRVMSSRSPLTPPPLLLLHAKAHHDSLSTNVADWKLEINKPVVIGVEQFRIRAVQCSTKAGQNQVGTDADGIEFQMKTKRGDAYVLLCS